MLKTHVPVDVTEEPSPNVRMIPFSMNENKRMLFQQRGTVLVEHVRGRMEE